MRYTFKLVIETTDAASRADALARAVIQQLAGLSGDEAIQNIIAIWDANRVNDPEIGNQVAVSWARPAAPAQPAQ